MKKILLCILLYSNLIHAKSILCGNNSCSIDFTPTQILEKSDYTSLIVNDNSDHISIAVPNTNDPRSIRMSVETNSYPGKNLTIDLSSQKSTANAANTIIIGNNFSNVDIKLNGFNGSRGQDVSEICASKMKSGYYGDDAKTFFINRRQAQEGLDPSRCDRTDISYLQSYSFSCDDASYSQLVGTNPVIDVKRLRFKARCSGILVQDMCLKRKIIANCTWRPYYYNCDKKGGCSSGWTGDPFTLSKKMAEEEYNYKRNSMNDQQFCVSELGQPGGQVALYGQTAYLTTPGVNPNDYTPLAGSDWELYYTSAYGKCQTFWTTVRTLYTAVNAYDETGNDCSDVGVASDPNHLIPWTYTGMAQEPEFGPEVLHCSVGECPVQSTLSQLDRNLDVLTPGDGTSGTQQGNGMIFAYEIQNYTSQAIPGVAGAGGKIDLDTLQSTKYCGKYRDYDTDGPTSDYARSPNVSFRKYNWSAIKYQSGGNSGAQPQATDNKIIMFKKISPAVRYFLSKKLL